MKKFFPSVDIPHSDVIQVDHCFTRGTKSLFLEVSNGTTVCSTCNLYKNLKLRSVARMIDLIVIKREGQARFDEMMVIDSSQKPFLEIKNASWLEEKVRELEDGIKQLNA